MLVWVFYVQELLLWVLFFNVRINAKDIKDRKFADEILAKATKIYQETLTIEQEVIAFIDGKM